MIEYASNDTIISFIQDHLSDDPEYLALQRDKYPDIPISFVVTQLLARQKSRTKLPFVARYPAFQFPSKLSYEQSSSEATATFKSSLYQGTRFLDLTGGLGVDSYFLSQQFKEGTYIDQDPTIASLAQHNFRVLGAENMQVIHSTAERFLNTCKDNFDLIYLDPARRGGGDQRVFKIEDCSPNVLSLINDLQKRAAVILWKASPMLDIKMVLNQLNNVFRVDIISVDNDVKEVLYHLKSSQTKDPEINALNLPSKEVFNFKYSEEASAEAIFSKVGTYLYEPNPAILKSGAFKSIGLRYNLKKLHPNTHLYTGEVPVNEFPGRKFKIINHLTPNKKRISSYIPEMKANVSCRNYPMSVEQLRKKTGLRDGGNCYLFATRDIDQKLLLLTEKIEDSP